MNQDLDIVVIGATGNLARRKLLPALYDLETQGLLPTRGRIVGTARSPFSQEAFRRMAEEAIKDEARTQWDDETWTGLAARFDYIQLPDGDLTQLRKELTQAERLIFLAIPPSYFGSTAQGLAEQGLVEGTRLLIEKPFGRDLESARGLDQELSSVLNESQIFRIDHYLGKETVQNILVFRFGNSVFERIWNRDAIEHIEITVAESTGMDGRGYFYEEVGALRDIVQNHLLQVLSLLTMEPPASFDAEAIRDEKVKLLQAIQPLDPANLVRGQYTSGRVDGQQVPGYRDEEKVDPHSEIETFAAAKIEIDNWRWAGVPIYLRTGKRLPYRSTEIEIAFKSVPRSYFGATAVDHVSPNTLTLCIQPEEEITFTFLAKVPGQEINVKQVSMNFNYESEFSGEPAEAYERLIRDAIEGDRTLFVRSDSVLRAWEIVQPALDSPPPLGFYPAGSWGPFEADELVSPLRWHLR
ncbi:MAG TPA: glucose-6-phosphate dehydrogenase [Dehalococcoidia bacterium]|nr:glucose-6-phosphate dehydrogenase [Dehalococcoidia bacterium]